MTRFLLPAIGLLLVALAGCARRLPAHQYASADNVKLLSKHLKGKADASADASAAPQLAEPTGFGTLKGRFKLVGTAPDRSPLRIDKEQDICAPGGKQVLEESIVVSSDGG